MYLNKSPSQEIAEFCPVSSSGNEEKTPTSTESLSLADLAGLHASTSAKETGSTNMSLTELASMHSLSTSSQQSEHVLAALSTDSPVLEANPVVTMGLDFSVGFATPKTASALSLSQLASLGTNPTPSSAVKSHDNDSSGLSALATAHFSSLGSLNETNPIDLNSVRPPPGFKRSKEPVLKTPEDVSLSAVVKKLTIQESNVVCIANASQFACVLCRSEKRSSKLESRRRHLKKRSWKKISNLNTRSFTFSTPSPDDFVLKKQKLVFDSDHQ